ncbi:hypothetical protein COCVIDRAFT_12822 [Bipolaris victoriae FI3]|uniref:Uncharacterized protein n=1 Tax=Bipolaris victoriae (strain FI3) TaxID=930091 RepID=W7EJS5_BIPV3|nr:hypothetical protein COCVIDRAFT_12822 [Bipolaris victoriae FI3]
MQSRGKYRCIGDRASYGASRKRASFQGRARGLARLRWARPSQAKTALSPLSIATLDILAPTAMPTAARRSLHPLDASAHHAGRACVCGWCVGEGERTSEGVCVCASSMCACACAVTTTRRRRLWGAGDPATTARVPISILSSRQSTGGTDGTRIRQRLWELVIGHWSSVWVQACREVGVLEHVEKGRWGEGGSRKEHHGSPETVIVAAQTSSICLVRPSLPLSASPVRRQTARPPVRHAGNVTRQSKMPLLVPSSPPPPIPAATTAALFGPLSSAAHPRPVLLCPALPCPALPCPALPCLPP